MKEGLLKNALSAFLLLPFLLSGHNSFGQCDEKISEATSRPIRYQNISLGNKHEYLRLSSTGNERVFSYHNENVDLAFHAQMYTEIRFTTSKGHFSLYTTTFFRTRWNTCFILSSPITAKEIEKMKGTSKIEVFLPEDRRVFSIDIKKNDALNKALACVF